MPLSALEVARSVKLPHQVSSQKGIYCRNKARNLQNKRPSPLGPQVRINAIHLVSNPPGNARLVTHCLEVLKSVERWTWLLRIPNVPCERVGSCCNWNLIVVVVQRGAIVVSGRVAIGKRVIGKRIIGTIGEMVTMGEKWVLGGADWSGNMVHP